MKEIWKDVKGYEGLYQISNLGNVKSLKYAGGNKPKNLKPTLNGGYYGVFLCKDGTKKRFTVHRLVALAFVPRIKNKALVNHINEIKTDNRVENLEWCNHSENVNYGTCPDRIGKSNLNHKSFSKPIIQLDKNDNIIREFPSFMEANRNGFDLGCLSRCVKGKQKFHKGYKFKYK